MTNPEPFNSMMPSPENTLSDGAHSVYIGSSGLVCIQKPHMPITYTPITQYELTFQVIPRGWQEIYQGLQIVEVGTGLSEFLPTFAMTARKKPIAIEPLDYQAVISLLEEAARTLPVDEVQRATIKMLIKRAHVMLDPGLITLFPLTLSRAIAAHPELKGVAEAPVIDLAGARLYEQNTSWVDRMEWEYLRKNPNRTLFGISRRFRLYTS